MKYSDGAMPNSLMFKPARRLCQKHQLFRMRIRQRLQQYSFHHAENGDVGADADGQGDRGHDRELRRADQPAQNVLPLDSEQCH